MRPALAIAALLCLALWAGGQCGGEWILRTADYLRSQT